MDLDSHARDKTQDGAVELIRNTNIGHPPLVNKLMASCRTSRLEHESVTKKPLLLCVSLPSACNSDMSLARGLGLSSCTMMQMEQ